MKRIIQTLGLVALLGCQGAESQYSASKPIGPKAEIVQIDGQMNKVRVKGPVDIEYDDGYRDELVFRGIVDGDDWSYHTLAEDARTLLDTAEISRDGKILERVVDNPATPGFDSYTFRHKDREITLFQEEGNVIAIDLENGKAYSNEDSEAMRDAQLENAQEMLSRVHEVLQVDAYFHPTPERNHYRD